MKPRGLDSLSGVRIVGDVNPDVLNLLAASGETDFQIERVAAVEILRGAIERDEGRHFGGQALLEIRRLENRAFDVDGPMRRCVDKADGRQRSGRAIRTNGGEDADS